MTRWIRWTETWTPPGHVGDYLEVKRDDRDGHLRDYRIPAPTPTAYLPCPRPASAPVQPPIPTPPKEDPPVQPVSPSTFLAIPEHLRIGALTRFRNEACWERDRLVCADDQVTGGAAALYFWPAYLGTIAALHQNGQAPVNGDWTAASVAGFEAACRAYWGAQGNPNPL